MSEQTDKLRKVLDDAREDRRGINEAKKLADCGDGLIGEYVGYECRRFKVLNDEESEIIVEAVEKIIKIREARLEPIERKLETLSELID
jgi:hypothetical protein